MRILFPIGTRALFLGSALLGTLVVTGCASDSGPYAGGGAELSGRIKSCRTGDTRVASESQCLQDDAACYQLSDGSWCTGERGNTCPTGSTQVPQGAACPPGARCFAFSESMTCAIGFK